MRKLTLHMFMLMLFLSLVLYFRSFTLATRFSSSYQSLSHEDECLILFQFKENMSTNDSASHFPGAYSKVASWKLNRSEGGSDCCLWEGVECSGESSHRHVTGLDLSSSFLYGPINSNNSLFDLVHLRRLNLADNDFRFSQISSAMGHLSQLTNLNLSHSNFNGQVPKEISHLNKLVSLHLSGMHLKMKSHHFRNLVQNSAETLKELILSEVGIDSQVPHILVNSSSLRSLDLRYCGLNGDFPTDIFHLPQLQLLDMQGNHNLSGYLPEFHDNSQLKYLILPETNFHGKVPASIGKLKHLNQLVLFNCSFSGPLPGSVSNLTQVTHLILDGNMFWGRIPSLASLSRLSYLILSSNQFNGRELSDWIGRLPNLFVLDLMSNNLSCEIPPSIGNLTQLRQLFLYENLMVGQIPSSLMNLTHLTELLLGLNVFTGSLPSLESLSSLTTLFLSSNNFDRWKLPDWLGKLDKLIHLQLYEVNLYGEIPSLVFNLTQLEALDLSANQFEGPIPPFPSTMTKLKYLYLGDNHLKGPIPSSLSNLKNVEYLLLNNNNISGTVEIDVFLRTKKLQNLYLGGNKITLSVINHHTNDALPKFKFLGLNSCNLRAFPDFLRFQDQLHGLFLDDNKIDGQIPEWMGNISKGTLRDISLSGNSITGFEHHWSSLPWVGLQLLDLSHNMLQGSIPIPPPTAQIFLISNNNLTGKIPPSICDMESLLVLDMSFNNIMGNIPSCLEKLSNTLLMLNLRGNTLQGTIPDIFINGSELQILDLSENQLEGKIPRSLEKCVSLEMIDLGNNRMEDTFPFWLGALSELQVLILRSNKFHGSIRISNKTNSEFPKLRIIDLSYNSFSGDLPYQYFEEWFAMKQLESDIAYMKTTLYGSLDMFIRWRRTYSYKMKMINKGVSMEYGWINNIFVAVDLSSNKFRGKIHESIKRLHSLQLLNLSNNELSGVIPSSMASLTQLESLDLSSNTLSGKIPQELVQMNFLEYLNVSYNNLTGPIPQGGQFSTFQNISYMGNPALCGKPLSKKCGNSDESKPLAVCESTDASDFPSRVDWVFILSGVGSGLVIGLLFGNHLTSIYYKWFLKRFRK